MRIGILGTGRVAQALAAAWGRAGHEVLLGSRRPAERAGPGGTAVVRVDEAVGQADVVVNTTPGTASLDVLAWIGAGDDSAAKRTIGLLLGDLG